MTYTLGKLPNRSNYSSTRQPKSTVSFDGIPAITEQEYKVQKLYKEGQMRSLDLAILDKTLLAKAWDVESAAEKVKQRQIDYNIQSTKTDTFDVKKLIADVGYQQEQTRLYLTEERHSQLEDQLSFEQARTNQERDFMTIQGNTRHLQIEEARLSLTQLQAGLKARYATDFAVLEGIFVE